MAKPIASDQCSDIAPQVSLACPCAGSDAPMNMRLMVSKKNALRMMYQLSERLALYECVICSIGVVIRAKLVRRSLGRICLLYGCSTLFQKKWNLG